MKNHLMLNGKLLKSNKRVTHLTLKQRAWIAEQLRTEYMAYLMKNGKEPSKEQKKAILDLVYDRIKEKEINIPYHEVRNYFAGRITRYNNHHRLLGESAKERSRG